MSFSNPKIKNPATKFIEFKGGQFQYYDKEKEDNIILPLPIYFVVLDELHTVRGYNKNHKSGVYANEIRSTRDELLSVKVFKSDIKIVGLWDKIKGDVERIQGVYSKSVYAGLIQKEEPMELVNFQFYGASRSPWFDLKVDKEKHIIGITETIDDENGSVQFKRPVFKAFKLKEEYVKPAIELDQKLQTYLKTYLIQKEEEIIDSGISDVVPIDTEPPDLVDIPSRKIQTDSPGTNPQGQRVYPDDAIEPTNDLPF